VLLVILPEARVWRDRHSGAAGCLLQSRSAQFCSD